MFKRFSFWVFILMFIPFLFWTWWEERYGFVLKNESLNLFGWKIFEGASRYWDILFVLVVAGITVFVCHHMDFVKKKNLLQGIFYFSLGIVAGFYYSPLVSVVFAISWIISFFAGLLDDTKFNPEIAYLPENFISAVSIFSFGISINLGFITGFIAIIVMYISIVFFYCIGMALSKLLPKSIHI